ncbi:hypothetical protein MAPG_00744 [Magnaporthiopsis poae ATCC 64411]|uniref:Heterokaryon incompatibility domain-containing protein n=1 Tax=Magnaporthiopsis poae (strain ATCC 64411 / 73-15) TaxID=644358 RepID=A0A0C4DLU8_MAGP6|nr:hypothetical protein MAPG_00744 [Magnaporthiopsis poae ATCC 64411]
MDTSNARLVQGARYPTLDANPCSACREITIEKLSSEHGCPHHPSLAQVQEAIDGGCRLCALIFDAIFRARGGPVVRQSLDPGIAKMLIVTTNDLPADGKNNTIRLLWRRGVGFKQHTNIGERCVANIVVSEQICITYGRAAISRAPGAPPVGEQLKSIEHLGKLALCIDKDSDVADRYPGRRLPVDLHAPSDQDALARWLKRCAAESEDAYIEQGATLPSRILDVGDSLDSETVHLRPAIHLHQSEQTARYIILSHCWGGKVPVASTTTSSTLQERETGIELEQLTQNFRDAVRLTRLLGARYLWIDALCIVQDSREDWQLESGRMGAYYKHSWLTLAAAMTGDSNGGLLGKRTPPMDPFVQLNPQPTPADGERAEIGGVKSPLFFAFDAIEPPDAHLLFGLRGRNNPYMFSGDLIKYEEAFQSDPSLDAKRKHLDSWQAILQTRGWTFQEELLSPRWVAFEPSQVYFRCDKFVEFESGRRLEPPDGESCFLSKGRVTFLKGDWRDVVQGYTARQLTFEADKLAAISGLAREFAMLRATKSGGTVQTAQDDYCAGLWKSQLPEGLLWGRPGFPTPGEIDNFTRTETFVAPSWSWASVNGRVTFGNRIIGSDKQVNAELLHVTAEPAGTDPLGQVSSGHVVLCGRCLWAKLPAEGLGTVKHGLVFNLDVREYKPEWEHQPALIIMITGTWGLILELQGALEFPEGSGSQYKVCQRIGVFCGPPEAVFDGPGYLENETVVII